LPPSRQPFYSFTNPVRDYLEQPAEKFPTNIADHGNSSSSSCPILLDECRAMSAFGAGFVSGAVLFEW
jgi:3-oxoacyl-[acyl-carrier-protein] synthase-3